MAKYRPTLTPKQTDNKNRPRIDVFVFQWQKSSSVVRKFAYRSRDAKIRMTMILIDPWRLNSARRSDGIHELVRKPPLLEILGAGRENRKIACTGDRRIPRAVQKSDHQANNSLFPPPTLNRLCVRISRRPRHGTHHWGIDNVLRLERRTSLKSISRSWRDVVTLGIRDTLSPSGKTLRPVPANHLVVSPYSNHWRAFLHDCTDRIRRKTAMAGKPSEVYNLNFSNRSPRY